MTFKSAQEMLNTLQDIDLYSPDAELYVFMYNDKGGIAYYEVDNDEAIKLACRAAEDGECWGAYLGVGGWICDAIDDTENPPNPNCSNLDFCGEVYMFNWIDTKDVIKLFGVTI